MTATSNRRGEPLDSTQGWLIVVLGIGILSTIWGALFTFTVYADRLATTYGLTALQTSSIFSITTAFLLVVGGVFGVFATRFPLRPVVVAVGIGLGFGTVALQFVDSYVGVIAAFALIGTSGGTVFTIVVSLVPQWFDTHQGLATSLSLTGLGLGPLVMPFVWLWLFERTDLRTAFAVVVGASVIVVLISSLVYRRPSNRSQNESAADLAWIYRLLTDPYFLTTMIGYALVWSWYYVLSSQLVSILTANGIAVGVAAAALSTIGGVSVFTRVGGGYLGDQVGQRKTFGASIILAGVCILALPFIHSQLLLYIDVVGLGAAFGPLAALWSPIVLTRFGTENATAIVGLLLIGSAGGAFLAPLGVNVLHRMTGGYTIPLFALSVFTVLGAALFYWSTAPMTNPPEPER